MTADLAQPVLTVGIVTVNLESMARFYTGFFGFKAMPELVFPGTGTVHRFIAGKSILRLMVPDEAPEHNGAAGEFLSATGYRYMTLAVTDIDAALPEAEAYGGKIALSPMTIRPGVKIAQLRDPDGNWIELVQED